MCSALQNNFREFCQDLPHQQRQVQALTDRYHAVGTSWICGEWPGQ